MKLFEQELNDYIKHHINPVSPNSLDPRVWYFLPGGGDPKIQPEVKAQILNLFTPGIDLPADLYLSLNPVKFDMILSDFAR